MRTREALAHSSSSRVRSSRHAVGCGIETRRAPTSAAYLLFCRWEKYSESVTDALHSRSVLLPGFLERGWPDSDVGFAPRSSQPHYINTCRTLAAIYQTHMRLPPSSTLRRRHRLPHPVRRRAPADGTVGLRNPASREPVRVRGNQVFGERSCAATGITPSSSDDGFHHIDNFFQTSATSSATSTWATTPTPPLLLLSPTLLSTCESLIDVLLTPNKFLSQNCTTARTKVYRKLLGDHKRLSDAHRATLADLKLAKGKYQT